MSNDDLIADFLAKGGSIRKFPTKGVNREDAKPEILKKREMLAELQARASEVKP